MSFNAPYVFGKDNLVVIRHKKNKNLRVKKNGDDVGENGGQGKFAQWYVELDGREDDCLVVKIKSKHTGKYLRIQGGNDLNAGGGGGKMTRFKVHKTGNNSAKLESCKFPGRYPAVKNSGPGVGNGGKWTEFEYFRQGGGGGGGGQQQQQQQQVQQVVQQVVQQQQVVYQQPQQQQVVYQQQPQQQQVQYQQQQQPQQQQQVQYQQPQQVQQQQQQGETSQGYEAKQNTNSNSNSNNNSNQQQQQFDPSQVHQQPLNDARPAIKENPKPDFDGAADKLRSAMKGMGTNEKKLIEVTTQYSHAQRMQIRDRFDSKFSRSLMKDLESETSGKLEKLILALWFREGELDARLVYDAVDGVGFNTKLLNEVVCTRTNGQLQAMKNAWSKSPGLIARVKSETSKTFGNNTYQGLIMGLLAGQRPPNGPPNEQFARADAETLNRVLSGKQSEAKSTFVNIFLQRSWVQLRTISNIFQDVSKKYTLQAAIAEAFGKGSDTSKALRIICEFVTQPYDMFAKLLKESMEGMGTDDSMLRRIVATRADIDMGNISSIFGQRYGDGKTLNNWIKNDTGGDYERLLLNACGVA